MVKRNQKRGYLYGLILNQEKYPVKVHRARRATGWDMLERRDIEILEAQCGAGVGQSVYDVHDRRNRIEVQHRLLDGKATVFCAKCYPERKDNR